MTKKIIGGAGFVGSRLCAELQDHLVLDKRLQGKNFCDITLPDTLESTIASEDAVVLLAAEHRDDVSPTSKYYETNVQRTSRSARVSVGDQSGKALLCVEDFVVFGAFLDKLVIQRSI